MRTILVTRPAGPSDPLVGLLEELGYRVHAIPTLKTEPIDFDAGGLGTCDWIVVTSVQGVNALRDIPAGPLFAAVGELTAAALRARGVEPAYVPPRANSASLGDSLPEVDGKHIALVRASAADGDLPGRLRRRGAMVEEISAYRTIEGPAASAGHLRDALDDPDLAAVVFASGSAIRGFMALGGTTRWPAITIGPRTSSTAREHGFRVATQAVAQSAESLAAAVTKAVPLKEDEDA